MNNIKTIICFVSTILFLLGAEIASAMPPTSNERYISPMEAEEMIVGEWEFSKLFYVQEGKEVEYESDDDSILIFHSNGSATIREDNFDTDEFVWNVFERENELWMEFPNGFTEEYKLIFHKGDLFLIYEYDREWITDSGVGLLYRRR